MKPVLLVLGLALAATPALSQERAPDTPAPSAKLDPRDPNYVRCKKVDVIGSLVKKERICKTNAQWAAIRDQQTKEADEFIRNSRAGNIPSS
jgi:hypothetical protein